MAAQGIRRSGRLKKRRSKAKTPQTGPLPAASLNHPSWAHRVRLDYLDRLQDLDDVKGEPHSLTAVVRRSGRADADLSRAEAARLLCIHNISYDKQLW